MSIEATIQHIPDTEPVLSEPIHEPNPPSAPRVQTEAVVDIFAPNFYADEFMAEPSVVAALGSEIDVYARNTRAIFNIQKEEMKKRELGKKDRLFGEAVTTEAVPRADGTPREVEVGFELNLDYLRQKGIDPSRVLVFRRTQPQDAASPKPELYWTTDYWEVAKGLTAEINGKARENSIVLISTLSAINENGGLIRDVNDDNGIPLRQRGSGTFDQNSNLVIAKLTNQQIVESLQANDLFSL